MQGNLIVQKKENHSHISGKVVISLTIHEVKGDKTRNMWLSRCTIE